MTFVCLWIPDWSTAAASTVEALALDQVMEALLRVAPRVTIAASGVIWADARGLPERALAERLCAAASRPREEKRERRKENGRRAGLGPVGATHASPSDTDRTSLANAAPPHRPDTPTINVHAGVARTPIVAEVAARHGTERVTLVPPDGDRGFLEPYPLSVLNEVAEVDPTLLTLLAGLGIETCGDLAALGREEVEVRCGSEGVRLWRLARAEDRRRPFGAFPRTLPRASCAWTDYALRDAERLLFVIRRLVAHVCDALRAQGEGARVLSLRFALANRTVVEHLCRAAQPTADSAAWLRLIRTDLEHLRFADAVTGIAVRVTAAAPTLDCQGDIFDRGFATARATEHAVAQLLDACGTDAFALTATKHPLLERRAQWQVREPGALASWSLVSSTGSTVPAPSLTVQLLPVPRKVRVVTAVRRDHAVPVRYDDGEVTVDLLTAVGPDCVDGGTWDGAPYARSYFHCVTVDGRLVLMFQAGAEWFLHGWWD
jgi:hypothetical protein